MTEPIEDRTSTTQPQPVLSDSAPPHRPAPAAPRHREPRTGISGVRVALIASIAAGTARITRFRQVMRRDRRKSSVR
jgi:hypothetical protein